MFQNRITMRNFIKTLAAVLCCLMIAIVVTSCQKSEEEMKSDLIGTWTEANTLFIDILKINEDGSFSFKCHIAAFNGEGHYRFEPSFKHTYEGRTVIANLLILNYGNKASQTLEIVKLNSSRLELAAGGNVFRLSK